MFVLVAVVQSDVTNKSWYCESGANPVGAMKSAIALPASSVTAKATGNKPCTIVFSNICCLLKVVMSNRAPWLPAAFVATQACAGNPSRTTRPSRHQEVPHQRIHAQPKNGAQRETLAWNPTLPIVPQFCEIVIENAGEDLMRI
jgi:hypothetical protein